MILGWSPSSALAVLVCNPLVSFMSLSSCLSVVAVMPCVRLYKCLCNLESKTFHWGPDLKLAGRPRGGRAGPGCRQSRGRARPEAGGREARPGAHGSASPEGLDVGLRRHGSKSFVTLGSRAADENHTAHTPVL